MTVLLGATVGAIWGLLADRLAARWPAHAGGSIRPVDWRTVVVPMTGALALGAVASRWTETRDLVVVGLYVSALIVLLATDLEQRLLPDLITLPLIPFALVVVLLGWDPQLAGKDLGIPSAIAAGLGAPVLLMMTDRLFGGSLGLGDVKLALSLGLMSGITRLVVGFLAASILGAVVILALIGARRITLKSAIPFGPILITGGIIAALLQS